MFHPRFCPHPGNHGSSDGIHNPRSAGGGATQASHGGGGRRERRTVRLRRSNADPHRWVADREGGGGGGGDVIHYNLVRNYRNLSFMGTDGVVYRATGITHATVLLDATVGEPISVREVIELTFGEMLSAGSTR